MSNTGTPGRRGRFRRGLLLTCLLVAALLFTGLRGEPARATQGLDNVSYRLVQDVPADLASWLDHSKQYPGLFRFSTGDTTYLLISWGEKRTGGHSLVLKGMRTEGEVIVAEVELKAPAPGDLLPRSSPIPTCWSPSQPRRRFSPPNSPVRPGYPRERAYPLAARTSSSMFPPLWQK